MSDKIKIDDFIDPDKTINIGIKVNPKARIVDFADMKIASIAPNVRSGIEWHLSEVKNKLGKLKNYLSK